MLCHAEEAGWFSSGNLLCVFALGKKFRELSNQLRISERQKREREDTRVIKNFDAKPIILKQKVFFFLFYLVFQGIKGFGVFFLPSVFPFTLNFY